MRAQLKMIFPLRKNVSCARESILRAGDNTACPGDTISCTRDNFIPACPFVGYYGAPERTYPELRTVCDKRL